MQAVAEKVIARAKELLASGEVQRVLGWEKGEFDYERTPALFDQNNIDKLVYDKFCAANLSKKLVEVSKLEGKTLALIKPCDSLSLNQLLCEHRVKRENIYVLGVGCKGMEGKDGLCMKCEFCKGKNFAISDEVIDDESCREVPVSDRFAAVRELEEKTPEERYAFWRSELSKCIRCNACRNVCPACTCIKCVFDNPDSGVAAKANVDTFEENQFHIIRAFHVAGRCTDCGECSRVCPQGIPLHLLNRKFIKDMDTLYGDYQAGEDAEARHPLINFTKADAEPSVVLNRGE